MCILETIVKPRYDYSQSFLTLNELISTCTYFEIITSQLDDASLVTSLFPAQKLGGINKLSAFANVDLEGCVTRTECENVQDADTHVMGGESEVCPSRPQVRGQSDSHVFGGNQRISKEL